MNERENLKLSILDIERKYTVNIDENTYGEDKMVAWGNNNDAPVLYLNCYRNSATLKSIIDGTANYVIGDNVTVNAEAWAEQVNRRGLTMRQFIKALALSLLQYGGYAFQVIYDKIGSPKELYPLDFRKCRVNESKTKVWYSKKNWTKYGTKAEQYDAYNPKNFDIEKPTQIYWFGGNDNTTIYPVPMYYGALTDVLTEIECSRYSLNSVANGFNARYLINFPENNSLTDEQKDGIEEAIKNKFGGAESDVNFMLYWQTSDKPITVAKIESDDAPEKFIAIKDNARQNIFVSFQATPLLFGLPNASNGFSTDEYKDSAKLFEKMVAAPLRDEITEAIDKVTGVNNSVSITPLTINFNEE